MLINVQDGIIADAHVHYALEKQAMEYQASRRLAAYRETALIYYRIRAELNGYVAYFIQLSSLRRRCRFELGAYGKNNMYIP